MVGTILPMVHGDRRRKRRPVAHWAHLTGAVIAGASVGALLGWFGSSLQSAQLGSAVLAATCAVALGYALHEAGLIKLPTPQRHSQVPIGWRSQYAPSVAAAMYGLGLGVGLLTHITTATFYVVCALCVASGSPLIGAITMGAYGLARGLPAVVLALVSRDLTDAFRMHDRFDRWGSRFVHVANGAALSFAGAYLATASIAG